MYDEIGGREGCRKLSERFYARVAKDPILRPLFGKTFTCAIEEFSAFLAQFLGGPSEDAQRRWWLSLHESHQRFKIGPKERTAWLKLMGETLDEIDISESHRTAFKAFFKRSSAYVINQADNGAIPHTGLAQRWDHQVKLDQTVAAIRQRKADALDLVESFKPNSAVFAGLLALLIHSGDKDALDYVMRALNPALALVEHSIQRTLLHEAVAAGQVELVEQLLQLGAGPHAGRHPPLYSVSNECRKPQEGACIVRMLVAAGAQVNFQENYQRTTALHMAARRGSTAIAQALLDCGADVNARDRNGATPLRRALNCNKPEVAKLLRLHKADL